VFLRIQVEAAVDPEHDQGGEVETDAGRYDGVCRGQVESAGGVLGVTRVVHQRLRRAMQAQRDGQERD